MNKSKNITGLGILGTTKLSFFVLCGVLSFSGTLWLSEFSSPSTSVDLFLAWPVTSCCFGGSINLVSRGTHLFSSYLEFQSWQKNFVCEKYRKQHKHKRVKGRLEVLILCTNEVSDPNSIIIWGQFCFPVAICLRIAHCCSAIRIIKIKNFNRFHTKYKFILLKTLAEIITRSIKLHIKQQKRSAYFE